MNKIVNSFKGGTNGLAAFLEIEDFSNLNVGLAFDEGFCFMSYNHYNQLIIIKKIDK